MNNLCITITSYIACERFGQMILYIFLHMTSWLCWVYGYNNASGVLYSQPKMQNCDAWVPFWYPFLPGIYFPINYYTHIPNKTWEMCILAFPCTILSISNNHTNQRGEQDVWCYFASIIQPQCGYSSYPLFDDADTEIYPHLPSQNHARLQFPYP